MNEQDDNPLPNKIVLLIVIIAVVMVVTVFSAVFTLLSSDIPKGNAQTTHTALIHSNP